MAHVVIADNDAVICDLVKRIVIMVGWTCDVAFDGLQAMELVARLVPEVVITDVRMSGLDGIELLQAIKQDSRLSQIPVVVISAVDRRSEATASGAAAFLPKPFTLEALLQVLSRLAPFNPQDIG